MRFAKLACFFCAMLMFTSLSAASGLVGGEDKNPAPGEAPFSILSRDAPSVDGETWSLSIEMNQEEFDNGTVFEITTQICTNDGVCDPPAIMDITLDERVHKISVQAKDDHTYINWRVKATWEDGNSTNFPQGDWYTTWSSCWQNNGTYGGVDSTWGEDGCIKVVDTPGFGALLAVSGVLMAAALIRRD